MYDWPLSPFLQKPQVFYCEKWRPNFYPVPKIDAHADTGCFAEESSIKD